VHNLSDQDYIESLEKELSELKSKNLHYLENEDRMKKKELEDTQKILQLNQEIAKLTQENKKKSELLSTMSMGNFSHKFFSTSQKFAHP
jgi:hypothetical protein